MSSNFKYALEKNKTKIMIGSSILLFAGIGAGSYFLFVDDKEKAGEVQEFENKLAEYVVTGDVNGVLNIIDTETTEPLDSITLPTGNYLYTANNGYDTLYAYDGKSVYAYELHKGMFTEKGLVAEIKVEGATEFKVDGNNIAILSNDESTLTYLYEVEGEVKTKVFELQGGVDSFHISKEALTYSTNSNLQSFSPTTEKVIDLGDGTNAITTFQDRVLIHNDFGSGLDNSILVSLDNENLEILGLEETLSPDTNLLSIDDGDPVFYTTQYVPSTEPYHVLDEWRIQDGKIMKEQNTPVRIPVGKDGIVYDGQTTVASSGYLYTNYNDRMQIFDIRSQDLLKDIYINEYFAMPVLANE